MSEWKAKRFWTDAVVTEEPCGFGVALDGRPVRTPAKAALVVPTAELASEIAREWAAQEGEIDPLSMPFTRSANAAIDKVDPQKAEVVEIIAAYGDSDLLCYRADTPAGLIARQTETWDPYLEWASAALNAPLETRTGLIHAAQSDTALRNLTETVATFDAFELTGLHDLVALSGSLVLGLAVALDHAEAEAAWKASRVDEDWQAEQWGVDEEAAQEAHLRREAFLHARRFLVAVRSD